MNFSKIKRILYCIALIKLALMSFACQEIKQHEDLFFLDKAKSNKTYQTQEENDEAKQYKKDMQEIQDLIQKRDLTGLLELKDAIAERWRTKVEIYSPLTSDICKALNSYDFKDNKQYLFARQCAEQVLKNSDEISVDLEKDMVGLLQETEEYRLEVAPQTDWKKDRNERVNFFSIYGID